ncbi:MAG TPA: RNA polymerase sigma factor [Steroidobacteraceae bacterium]|nr:RNA polymerase sigma factor [Steroidobacteraceae bacterium]
MDDLQLNGLIRRAQSGDVTSFGELLDRYYDTIYRFAWKWCGHRTNAQDIAQQACLKLAGSLAQFRFQSSFTSWLYRLVIHCAQDWQRAQQRHDHDALSEDAPAAEAARTEDAIYLAQLLEQLDELGEGMRETALLVHAAGLSHAEAGEVLGVAEATISWRVHAIRKHMNKREALMSGGGL